MSKTYRIKPLVWKEHQRDRLLATVSEGDYTVWQGAGCWFWATPGAFLGNKTASEADAKLAAEQHWHDRIAAALEEVGNE